MTEQVKVSPAPIQRNDRDVAIELTKLHLRTNTVYEEKELANLYASFYALSANLSNGNSKRLLPLLNEDIKEKIKGE